MAPFYRVEYTRRIGIVGRDRLPDSTPITELGLDPLTSSPLVDHGLPTLGHVRAFLEDGGDLTTIHRFGQQRAAVLRERLAEAEAVPGGIDPKRIHDVFNEAMNRGHIAAGGKVHGDHVQNPGSLGPPRLDFVQADGFWVMRIRCANHTGQLRYGRFPKTDPHWHRYSGEEPFATVIED